MSLTIIAPAYAGGRVSRGSARDRGDGYAADDPPEDAVVRCERCGWIGDESELTPEGDCPECGMGEG